MDFVVVTHAPDVKLLRHFLASYELYYQSKDRVFVFTSRSEQNLFEQIQLPRNATLLYREDYPELEGTTAYSQQPYLKMISYQVVTTEYFCIMDSDFLFVQPTSDEDFLLHGKLAWFYRPWLENEPPLLRWRKQSESFVGHKMDYLYCVIPQYVFKRSIAADFAAHYPLKNMLNNNDILEFQIYGWFAHKNGKGNYGFMLGDESSTLPIAAKVNQIPPDYCHLDPTCNYSQFKAFKYVAFWSHWELAEAKMIEFFEDSQRDHYGKVLVEANRGPFLR